MAGVKWSVARNSAAGEALRAEFAPGGDAALPGLPCLLNSRDFLIASPPLMVGANAGCSVAEVRAQAAAIGMKRTAYKGIELWVAAEKSGWSIAQWNERVLLIGFRSDLQGAIDRSQAENRTYSPLLIAAAKQSRLQDVWVVSGDEADPIAGPFALLAERIEAEKQGLAVKAQGPAAPVTAAVKVEVEQRVAQPVERSVESALEQPKVEPAKPEIAKKEIARSEPVKTEPVKASEAKPQPRVIRIYGLDEGPREIVLPPKDPR